MIINEKGKISIEVNSSFSSQKAEGDKIKTEQGIVIGPSGNPFLLEVNSLQKNYTIENLYLNFKTHPINGSISGAAIVNKGEFNFQDTLFHNPVLIFKNDKNAGINSDIVHYQPDYGRINIQIIEELVDDPNRFIVKISDFDNFYNTGDRKLYIETYVTKGGGIKILGSTKTLDDNVYEYGKLQLKNNLDQDKVNSETTSYFVPLASIDTDRIDFTVLY